MRNSKCSRISLDLEYVALVMLKVIFYLRFAMANLIITVIFHYSTVLEFPLFCNMKIIKPWVMIGVIISSCRKANFFSLHLWETFVTFVAKIHVCYTCWNSSITLVGNFFLWLWEIYYSCGNYYTCVKIYYTCGSYYI